MENARNKQIILKVYLDSSERKFIEVPIGPETSCRDIIDCCKEPGEQLCHLAELWRDCERPINETERPYDILEEWGIHRDEVKFYLRHEAAVGLSMRPGEQGRRNPYGYSRGDMRLDGGHNNHMHRGPGSELTLSELQDMASRQQQQIEQQQQMLLAKEQRLKFLKQQETRQQQLTAENERLRQLREKVEAQELKLKKLRAMRGQVDAFKNNNTTLGTELDSVKKMFNEKEKELAVAVAKVEQLTNQLEQLHTSYVKGVTPPETKTSEIEKLRQELMMRNKLNEDQNKKLTANTGVINSKKSEMSFLDKKIKELQERLRKKRSQISEKPKSNVAAVEPYIKRAPENLTKDDMYSVENLKAGFGKENPKYQTLPYNTKFPDAGKAEDDLKYGDKMFINGGSGETRTEVPNINEPSKKIPITLATSMLSAAGQPSQSQAKPVTAELVKGTWPSRPGANIRNFGPKPYGQSYGVSMIPGAPLAPVRLQADGQSESSGQSSPVTSDHGPTTETTSPLQHKQINQVAPSKEVQYPPSQPPKENTQSQWATPEKGKERTPPPPLATSIAKYSTPIKKTAPASVYGQFKVTDSPKVSVVERQTVEPIQATQPVVVSTHQPEQPKLTEPTVTLKSLGNVSSGSGVTTTVQGGGEEKKNVKSVEGALNVLMTGKPATVATAQPYKYAPKSIANPYLNRLGSGAMDRYKQNMKNIYEPKQQEKQPETQTEVKIQTESPTAKVHPLNVNRPISPVKTTYGQKASHTPIPIQTMDNRPLKRPMSPNRANNQNIEVNRNIGPPSYTYAEQLRNQSTTDSNANFDSTPSIIHTNNTPMPFDTPKTSTPLTTLSSQNSQNQPNTVQYTPSAPKPTRRQIPVDNVSMATTPSPTSPSQQTEPPGSNADYLSTSQTFVNSNLDKNMRRQLFLYGTATLPQSPDSQSEQQQTSPTNYQTSPTNRQPSPQRTSPTRPLSPKKPHSEPAAKVNMRKKTNLRNKDSVKKSRRVSFDPLALLLDASLEGELELVMRTAKEVSNPSAANDEGITALHNAICAGHLDIVKFLIEFGCDSNSQDSDGWTPLHCAASCNNLPMVKFLVEHGACIFATTISDSETAAEKCEEDEDGYDGCSEFLYSIQEKLGILNGGVVYTLYQYKAQNPDELSFNPGYRMVVLRKGDEKEKDWWWVRHEDKEGYVARNLLGLYPRVRPKFPAPDSQA